MFAKDEFFKRLHFLSPTSKFVFWNYTGDEDIKGYESPYEIVHLDDWQLVWYPENSDPIPTIEQIQAVNETTMNAWFESQRKIARNEGMENNLSIKGAYLIAKASDPELTFTDYLDWLEEQVVN